ncbi:hypothetical protein ACA910_001162 [Epithemia clementina (nom. ined.)]
MILNIHLFSCHNLFIFRVSCLKPFYSSQFVAKSTGNCASTRNTTEALSTDNGGGAPEKGRQEQPTTDDDPAQAPNLVNVSFSSESEEDAQPTASLLEHWHDPKQKVKILFQDGSSGEYDFLIVAADPQDGLTAKMMTRSKEEGKAFDPQSMQAFYFQTTLVKFPKLVEKGSNYFPTVRFNPYNLDKTAGAPYGYRSETRKEANYLASKAADAFGAFEKEMNKVQFEYVTIYQLLDPNKPENTMMNQAELAKKLDHEMSQVETQTWFPYAWEHKEIVDCFHTKYFCHYTMDALLKKENQSNNWDLLGLQGQNNTIYVHASTAFESVLHIYEYINMLWSSKRNVFPKNKSSKIAIVGIER